METGFGDGAGQALRAGTAFDGAHHGRRALFGEYGFDGFCEHVRVSFSAGQRRSAARIARTGNTGRTMLDDRICTTAPWSRDA